MTSEHMNTDSGNTAPKGHSARLRRWDVEVVAEQFIGHDLVDNIAEVRDVDVFMDFHGAGFVNSFYMQPVCGWHLW